MRNNYGYYLGLVNRDVFTKTTGKYFMKSGNEFVKIVNDSWKGNKASDFVKDLNDLKGSGACVTPINRAGGITCRETLVYSLAGYSNRCSIGTEMGYATMLRVTAFGSEDSRSVATFKTLTSRQVDNLRAIIGYILGVDFELAVDTDTSDGSTGFILDMNYSDTTSPIKVSTALMVLRLLYNLMLTDREILSNYNITTFASRMANLIATNKLRASFGGAWGGEKSQLMSLCAFMLVPGHSRYRSSTGDLSNGPNTFVDINFKRSWWIEMLNQLDEVSINSVRDLYADDVVQSAVKYVAGLRSSVKADPHTSLAIINNWDEDDGGHDDEDDEDNDDE